MSLLFLELKGAPRLAILSPHPVMLRYAQHLAAPHNGPFAQGVPTNASFTGEEGKKPCLHSNMGRPLEAAC